MFLLFKIGIIVPRITVKSAAGQIQNPCGRLIDKITVMGYIKYRSAVVI